MRITLTGPSTPIGVASGDAMTSNPNPLTARALQVLHLRDLAAGGGELRHSDAGALLEARAGRLAAHRTIVAAEASGLTRLEYRLTGLHVVLAAEQREAA